MKCVSHYRNAPAPGEQASVEQAIAALLRRWQMRANTLNQKRCTGNVRTEWIARGRQSALGRACGQLQAICRRPHTSSLFSLALWDYLHCLEQCQLDAEEERNDVQQQQILQWKAEGEAQELTAMCCALTHLIATHVPSRILDTLLLDFEGRYALMRADH